MVAKERQKINLNVGIETKEKLVEMAKEMNYDISRVVDALVGTFDEKTLPLVNYLRKKIGKEPLKSRKNIRKMFK